MDILLQGVDNNEFLLGDNFHSTDQGFEILTMNSSGYQKHVSSSTENNIAQAHEIPVDEPDTDDINVISIDPSEIHPISTSYDYLDLAVKAAGIIAGCITHPYIAYSTLFATASTALVAVGSNYFESDTYDYAAKTFLKIQNGALRHVTLMGTLRDASYGINFKDGTKVEGQTPSYLANIFTQLGLGEWNNKKSESVTRVQQELVVHLFSNLFSTFFGESHADLSNKLILEKITNGRLEMEHEDFIKKRVPITLEKRLIKFGVDKYLKPFEDMFENKYFAVADKNEIFKAFSILNHFSGNLKIAVEYNELSTFITLRTLSHSVAKYASEYLSYVAFKHLFGTHNFFDGVFNNDHNYTETDKDFTKLISIVFGSAGYTLSKELWDYMPKWLGWGKKYSK